MHHSFTNHHPYSCHMVTTKHPHSFMWQFPKTHIPTVPSTSQTLFLQSASKPSPKQKSFAAKNSLPHKDSPKPGISPQINPKSDQPHRQNRRFFTGHLSCSPHIAFSSAANTIIWQFRNLDPPQKPSSNLPKTMKQTTQVPKPKQSLNNTIDKFTQTDNNQNR